MIPLRFHVWVVKFLQSPDELVPLYLLSVSYTHLDVYKRQELGNDFVNDRQVDIAVMGISLRTVTACSNLV